jgi:hypothetical protein
LHLEPRERHELVALLLCHDYINFVPLSAHPLAIAASLLVAASRFAIGAVHAIALGRCECHRPLEHHLEITASDLLLNCANRSRHTSLLLPAVCCALRNAVVGSWLCSFMSRSGIGSADVIAVTVLAILHCHLAPLASALWLHVLFADWLAASHVTAATRGLFYKWPHTATFAVGGVEALV